MKHRIFPEALVGKRGEKWKVSEAPGWSGATEVGKKIMFIPGAQDPIAHNIRLHELGHATWSPKDNALVFARKWGVTPEAVQRAEDARIGFALTEIRPEYKAGLIKDLDDPQVREQIISNAHKGLLAKSGETLRQMVLELASVCMTEQAQTLQDLFVEGARRAEAGPGGASSSSPDDLQYVLRSVSCRLADLGLPGRRAPIASLKRLRQMAELLDHLAPPPPKISNEPPPKKTKGEVVPDTGKGWGKMEIIRPPLCRPQNAAMRRMKIRATEEGAVPGRIERLFTDGAIFSRVERQRGASVLLDISGSMGLSTEEIKDFLTRIPAATIATYCGRGGVGHLRVVAERGKIASDADVCYRLGGNNLIDGPALEWLGKQPLEPRFWVSDGQVTGIGDLCSADLHAIAQALCVRHKIRRVDGLDEALQLLGGSRARAS